MMPAAKPGDPQVGVDIHLCIVPPSPSPVPLPTPHMSIVFDVFDYIPRIGATVTVCGMKRAVAGTSGKAVHIPPGFPFAPKIPDTSDEIFMGSATVLADSNPFSFLTVPVLACQVAGMLSPPRLKQHEKKMMLLPTVTNLAIPTNVFVGGPPTISLMGMAFKLGFAALGRFAKSGLFKRVRQKLFSKMKSGFIKCVILRAEPVDITTGAVSVEQEDFVLHGPIPLNWVRCYSSLNENSGACGYGWESPADTRLEIHPSDGSAAFLCAGKPAAVFPQSPQAEGHAAAVLELWDGALLIDNGREFQVRTKDDLIYHFSKQDALVGKGEARRHSLSRISDLCGHWLDFERNGSHLARIRDSTGRRAEFVTDQDGRIRHVEQHFEQEGVALVHRCCAYDYDAAGDLVEVRDAMGSPYRFAYEQHHMIRHTDRNGLSFRYGYQQANGQWRVVHAWGDGGLHDFQFAWLDAASQVRITDPQGQVWVVTLDSNGLPVSEIDPLAGVTSFEYDEVGRTVAVTNQNGHRTEYAYDDRGNLLQLTLPDGTTQHTAYDKQNKVLQVTDAKGSMWSHEWNSQGLLTRRTSPLGHVSGYEYDASGGLVRYVDPAGACYGVTVDRSGDVVAIQDPEGRQTQLVYDFWGNVVEKVEPSGRRTGYEYDAKQRLTAVRLPSGATIQAAYDAADNLISCRNQAGHQTRYEYVGQGTLARRIQPDGATIRYYYDKEERLVALHNERDELHRLKRDELGRVVEEIDYWANSRRYEFDPGGRLTATIDALDQRMSIVMDPLGRILNRTAPSGAEESFTYDANGNLIEAANEHTVIVRKFDPENRLVSEAQGGDFLIENAYDAHGNRISRTTRIGNRITTTKCDYDSRDQVSSIRIGSADPIVFHYDSDGQIIGERLTAQLHRTVGYSADGNLARQAFCSAGAELFSCEYDYDPIGNLLRVTDSELGADHYGYDQLGQLVFHGNPIAGDERHHHDPAGDLLATSIETESDGKGWRRVGNCRGNRYEYDRAGNLVSKCSGGSPIELSWDAFQRLAISRSERGVTRYGYDPLGRRTYKSGPDGATQFYWDGDTMVCETANARLKEYVYYPDSFEPLAIVQHHADSESLLFFDNRHNGCPTKLVDTRGRVVWSATYDAWGCPTRINRTEVDNQLRLQGQYYDSETDLCYNRYRYYDPRIGCFTSKDPLGLEAGYHPYKYGPNALGWIDPLGLSCAIARKISDKIPARFKKLFMCKQYAKELQKRLEAQGIHGVKLHMESGTGFIYSNALKKLIAEDGNHVAIQVENMVFDNLHPQGIPKAQWLADLGAPHSITPPLGRLTETPF